MHAGLVGRKLVMRWERAVSRTGQAEPGCGAEEGTGGSWERREGGYCGERWRERNKDRLTHS